MRNPPNESGERLIDKTDAHVPERTCVLTRSKGTRDSLIRLALRPDGQVGPDVRARAPGRGAWISVGRAELDAANAKGKLKAALARAFKAADLKVPPDLGEQIERALRQAALDRLGLEARGGTLLSGADRIEAAARAGKVHLLIHAADAGEDGQRSLDQALRAGGRAGGGQARGLIFPEERSILSMALGRENVVHVALTDPAAASRVSRALARWRAFTDPRTGLDGGVPASAPGSADEIDEGQE
ncbi:MAG TPA: DUF448 domain-containing protein [Sphingomicrobium sp.]|nr:DUF448 domain-containing protein [Sphingomicrobium sp.]